MDSKRRKGNVNFSIKGKSTRITDCDHHFKENKWSDEIGGFQQANSESLAGEGLWVLGDENKSFTLFLAPVTVSGTQEWFSDC